ncbi:DUF257 family protein [Palaeococcus ferrophilus]|uniref:DUF257 family protein n=1 Tax=Palaeococcus ferrophilus TaxID=83868 RepID=UPI00064FF520|nr:DUF257 family protein [Palaeococcus ferrophilus]
MDEFSKLFDALTPGENVLVIYEPEYPPYALLLALVSRALEEGTPVIVDDVIDTLHLYLSQMALLGFDVSPLEKVTVLKIGGVINRGNVVTRMSLDEDVDIHISRYSSVFGSLLDGGKVPLNIVLGVDKLFAFYSDNTRAIVRIATVPGELAEGRRRTAVYFVNRPILETFPGLIAMLKDFFTTILVVGDNLRECRIKVVRSSKIEMMGEEITLTRA